MSFWIIWRKKTDKWQTDRQTDRKADRERDIQLSASRVKRIGKRKKFQFSDWQLKISDKTDMGVQNLNCAPELDQNGGFPNLKEIKFCNRLKFMCGRLAVAATTPLETDKTAPFVRRRWICIAYTRILLYKPQTSLCTIAGHKDVYG